MASRHERLRLVLTPIWDAPKGERLKIARMLMKRRQVDIAALLSTPKHPVHQQQIDRVEKGELTRINVNWARLESVFGKHLGFILIASDDALYNRELITNQFSDHYQRAMRKRNGLDPKKGETAPWPEVLSTVRKRPWHRRKRGSVQ